VEESIEKLIGKILADRGLTISVAESCTGGLIGSMITDVPGSSRYFLGGIIAYSNQSKIEILNVSSKTVAEHGAVSDQTAREMAGGVRRLFNSHLGLAVTGIAGPDGGSMEKPVGTVYIGLAAEDRIFAAGYRFHGTRGEIKQETARMALGNLRRYLNNDTFLPGI
jgi:nicotinamide-nucleotide amidase